MSLEVWILNILPAYAEMHVKVKQMHLWEYAWSRTSYCGTGQRCHVTVKASMQHVNIAALTPFLNYFAPLLSLHFS